MSVFDRLFRRQDEAEEEQRHRVLAEPFTSMGGAALLTPCDTVPGAHGRFGLDLTNPIPVNGVGGEIVYLNMLRARSGVGLLFHRIGSKRTEVHPQPVDEYEVVAIDASQWAHVFFSMYYPRRSRLVPDGFERKRWSSLPGEIRGMVHLPAMGVTQFVRDFPHGLPDAVRNSPMLRGISPGIGDSMARGVERILERSRGQWGRSEEVDRTASSGAPIHGGDSSGDAVDAAKVAGLIKKHVAILRDAGTTGDPRDYERELNYFPPGGESRALNKGLWICGCCMAPFSIDPEKVGMWFALNHKRGIPVAFCAVCIEFLNDAHRKAGRPVLPLLRDYDTMGQDLATRFRGEIPAKVAVMRIALIDARSKS